MVISLPQQHQQSDITMWWLRSCVQEFSIQNDSDFPALGGAAGNDAAGTEGDKSATAATDGKDKASGSAADASSPLPGGGALSAATSSADKYGLLGLLHVIRMSEPDLTMLALGTDLTGLGLNLNAPDSLYKVKRIQH